MVVIWLSNGLNLIASVIKKVLKWFAFHFHGLQKGLILTTMVCNKLLNGLVFVDHGYVYVII
jgi:hypothetical protein